MGVRVRVARTSAELRALFQVRHQVFVEEDGYLPAQGGVIVDLYDALPTTDNLVAVVDGEVSGGVRVTEDGAAGMPADDYFDFRRVVPAGARIASASMLCLRRSNRASARLLMGMLQMCVYWASARNLTHLCAPVNPKVEEVLARVGLGRVGEPFTDPKGLATVPMVLDLAQMVPGFRRFVERQDVGLWLDSFERAFFSEGDTIVRRGDAASEAYLLLDGAAAAVAEGPPRVELQHFSPGDVFGELALLTDRPRSASVVATEPTDVMVLGRDAFERQLRANPALAMALMRSMGDRFHSAVARSVDAQ